MVVNDIFRITPTICKTRACRLFSLCFFRNVCRMFKAVLLRGSILLGLAALVPARAQSGAELASLREDVRALNRTVGELNLRLEQLERENGDLRAKNAGASRSYATVAQLNEAVADLTRLVKSSSAATKNETMQHVSAQLEKMAKQTNAAMASLAKSVGGRTGSVSAGEKGGESPVSQPPVFSDDYPKDGVPYKVVKGDSLAIIAKKTGARERDIRNANKIADPSKLQVGQELFIPLAKKE